MIQSQLFFILFIALMLFGVWQLFRKSKNRIFSSDGRALSFVFFVVLVFFFTHWLFQGAWFPDDLVDLFSITAPGEDLYSQVQRAGESPLWAPELAGGYPLLATSGLGFWYLPHMLLRQFLPGVWTFNISMLLHSLLAALGTFLFLRVNKINVNAAIVGALLLPLGGAFVGKFILVNLILPFAWVPIVFLLLQLFLKKGQLSFFLGWVAVSTFFVLVGHPQVTVQIFIFEALFVITLVWLDWRRWSRALVVLLGVFLIIGLTLLTLLPTLDVVPFSDRANGISTEKLLEFSFPLRAMKGIVIAHPFGHGDSYEGPKNEAELASYLGPLAIALAFLGLLTGRKRFRFLWLFSVVSIISGLLLAFGGSSPVYRWLVSVGWRYFNIPARFFLFVHFGLVFLAAIGVHYLIHRVSNRRLRFGVIGLLFITTVVPVLWVNWSWYPGTPWEFTKKPAMIKVLEQQDGLVRVFSKEQLSDVAPNNNFGIMVWDPICSKCLYRQSFVSPFAAIQGINLKLSQASGVGTVSLKLFNGDGELLREASLSVKDIIDGEGNEFSFQPLEKVLNVPLYFEITSDIPR